jgi:hypothetical protein
MQLRFKCSALINDLGAQSCIHLVPQPDKSIAGIFQRDLSSGRRRSAEPFMSSIKRRRNGLTESVFIGNSCLG